MAEGGRLRRRDEFQRVYAHGIKVVGRFLVLFFMRREEPVYRLGITATRRIGNAVTRNRARRRVRELLRRGEATVAGLNGDLVVNVRRGADGVAWAELEEDFTRCVARVRRRLSDSAPS